MTYTEPQVSFLVLDYLRPEAARLCLRSIRDRVKLDRYKIIYCHNGLADYPKELLNDGLIDELIQPRANGGLGLGTRALFAACFSPYAIYWQVDQLMGRDFEQRELTALSSRVLSYDTSVPHATRAIRSVSLAGPVCGAGVYSERAHFVATRFYRDMEHGLPLSPGGAGPYHDLLWREGQIQALYERQSYTHDTSWPLLAIDNGRDAVRQNPDGSVWKHEPDRKGLWLLSGPVKERFVYPKLTDAEWNEVLSTQAWPPGKIPSQELTDSFHVWN